jgi:hypothetical protein
MLCLMTTAVVLPFLPTASPVAPAGALDPALAGQQEVLACLAPHRFIHGNLLPNGRAVLSAGSGSNATATDPAKWYSATTVPGTCDYKTIQVPYDVFCSISSNLPNGNVLSAGGNRTYETPDLYYTGDPGSAVFDWQTETWGPVIRMPGEFAGRWYPTGTKLLDGNIYVVAGLDERAFHNKDAIEFDWQTSTWSTKPYQLRWPLYPKNFYLGGDSVFFSGGRLGGYAMTPRFVNVETGAQKAVTGLRNIGNRDQGAALLLYPAQNKRILVMGGGNEGAKTVTNMADVIDLKAATPKFVPAANMPVAASQFVATNLPNGTVYAAGGTTVISKTSVQWAGLYDPATNTWKQAAVPTVKRGYHTFALLNDEGDVVVYTTNNRGVAFDRKVEVYHPPYRFNAKRPTVSNVPAEMTRGGTAGITVANASTIKQIVLDHPNAITHTTDVDQRMINVPYTRDGTAVTLQIPGDEGLVLPGWYRIWVVDGRGGVSKAVWTHIG